MNSPIAFLFSGQGAQQVGMGADLMSIPECTEIFQKADAQLGYSLSQICFEGPEETLTQTRYCQPALYVHGLACLAVFKKQTEINPSYAAGLSLGEFSAHAAAGTFSFEEGLRLVALRGQAMQEACEESQGGMLSLIGATPEQAQEIAKQADVDVANLNCPGQIVLSGLAINLSQATTVAKEKGIKKIIPLKVAGAYHSRLMKSAKEKLADALTTTKIETPRYPVIANITARPINEPDKIRQTLLDQVTGSVRWEESIRYLQQQGITHFIEFGPGGILAGLIKRIDASLKVTSISSMVSLNNINANECCY